MAVSGASKSTYNMWLRFHFLLRSKGGDLMGNVLETPVSNRFLTESSKQILVFN